MTPREAWLQVAEQIRLDNREQDCLMLLNFLRVSTVMRRGNVRNQPAEPPATVHPTAFVSPIDGPVIQHIHRKLRNLLPALFLIPQNEAAPLAQTAAMIGQTVLAGFEALRQDRAAEREQAAAPPSFSKAYPANAVSIRQICHAGDDDDALPEFWRYFATVKNRKTALSGFINLVTLRANQAGSSRVVPIISPSLFNHIAAFELGTKDLETITQGVSPFLMCPIGHTKVKELAVLTQRFMDIHSGQSVPTISDVESLAPINDYSIPADMHSLVDFIGAYSIVWDVLVGIDHPLATAIRDHYFYWQTNVSAIRRAIPDEYLVRPVIIGTLRLIQLAVLRYVHKIMFNDANADVPTFQNIIDNIDNRLFQHFPGLPNEYKRPATAAVAAKYTKLPPPITGTPVPPKGSPPPGLQNTIRNMVVAPDSEKHPQLKAAFDNGDKSIQVLKTLPNLPKEKKGSGILCLSYHLRGQCFDNCRRASTHRKLDPVEVDNIQAFLDKHT
jgi:hypothetical protein